jgi:hypothetical protein
VVPVNGVFEVYFFHMIRSACPPRSDR